MSKEQQLSLHGHDGDSDILATKHFHRGDEESDEENSGINEIDKATIKMSRPRVTSATVSSKHIRMIDTFDRPMTPTVNIEGSYANQGSSGSGFENKSGKMIPRAGNFEEKGFGRVLVKAGSFEAEVKGPNSSYSDEFSLVKFEKMARVELASASAKSGSFGVKVGVGFDTGASAGLDGVEAKVLGTGFSLGSKNSVSVLGSEVSCSVM